MVRVRFAPSPTGALHIGGVRTALYNYLFARAHGGTFILRIEDTDSGRFVPGAEQYIVEALKWCGIVVDEGVSVGGPHAPYRQSERSEIYLKYATELVAKGDAYYAFDTAQELAALRARKEAAGEAFAYNFQIREKLRTSLTMSPGELEELLGNGTQYVIRYKMPKDEQIVMQDLIRGQVIVNSSTLDDKVLYKSMDHLPTYHLANIVDDHLMQITHVIRGEEWLPSLPLHYVLYRSLGWSDTQPQFAHLPLILKPDGKGKLSKRDGDKLGFAVFPLQWTPEVGDGARGFREDGFLPDAFINMLALLGWSPGGDREIMTMEDMVADFSLDKVSRSGARFDPDKARWINAEYLHHSSDAFLAEYLMPILREHHIEASVAYVEHVCSLVKERATLLTDLWDLSRFYFIAPTEYDQKVVAKFWKGDNPRHLARILEIVKAMDTIQEQTAQATIHDFITQEGLPMGGVMNTLRLSLVGANMGASCFAIMETLGQKESVQRIEQALKILPMNDN
ncbi:MAG: glutamate--tRNA ligase [Mucinivorans sp.]